MSLPIIITRPIGCFPQFPILRKLANKYNVRLDGNKEAGSFASGSVKGNYEYGAEEEMHGAFAGYGVEGDFSIKNDQIVVTITDKPFLLPESILKQKIVEGLEAFCDELG